MDPTANLSDQLRIVYKCQQGTATLQDLARLVDLVEALDSWLSNGGFLPNQWVR